LQIDTRIGGLHTNELSRLVLHVENSWGDDILWLHDLAMAACRRGGEIVEIGAHYGFSTAMLFSVALAKNANFTSVDCLDRVAEINSCRDLPGWKLVIQDGANYAAGLASDSVDVILVDASHEYEATQREIAAWLPKLRIGGVMVLHDVAFARCGVWRAVVEVLGLDSAEPALDEDLAHITRVGDYFYSHHPNSQNRRGRRVGVGVVSCARRGNGS
jgi:hypothetical protein